MQEPGSEYSHLDPEEDGLGPLEENDLIAFAYQIADGMVRTLGEGEIPYHLVETNIGIRRDGCTLLRESQVNRCQPICHIHVQYVCCMRM